MSIIRDSKQRCQFCGLPNVTYVLLGGDECDDPSVIVARNQEYQIEEYNNACAYSGWVMLAKSGHINDDDSIFLLEYDIADFNPILANAMGDYVGLFELYSTHHMFLDWEPSLRQSLNRVIDTKKYFKKERVPMTSNTVVSGRVLRVLAAELDEAIHKLGNIPTLGHVLERLVVFLLWKYNINVHFFTGFVDHDMKCSHGQLKGY